MTTTMIERRLRALEATKVDRPRTSGTPEQCASKFGYSLDQAIAEFGSFPTFCYAMMIHPDPNFVSTGGDARQAYMDMLGSRRQ